MGYAPCFVTSSRRTQSPYRRQAADLPIAGRGGLAGDSSPFLVRRRSLPPPLFAERFGVGEAVPAGEKLSSLFETHADVIVNGGRGVHHGHKLNLATGGRSGLILDVVVEAGNPADAERFLPILERHIARQGTPPGNGGGDVWLQRQYWRAVLLPLPHRAVQGFGAPVSVPVRDTQQLVDRAANIAHEKTLAMVGESI